MEETFSTARCTFGVATRDVTPPVGIYARSWGAATHEAADGVHRPFLATAAVFSPLEEDGPELTLVAVDIGWLQYGPDETVLRESIRARTGLGEAELLIAMSHTHAGANANSQLTDKPGAELIQPYLDRLADEITGAILEARSSGAAAFVTFGHGRCALATNRDFWDEAAGRYACGYNPGVPADDTLLVARVSDDDGTVLATLFNYACHPTTLAWDNRLLSPDYIGAAREVLERAFDAPALFLHGASGELGPRDNYVGDTAVADRNGRQLGYAAAAAIETLPPAGTRFVYTGIVASGANLGTWAYEPWDDAQRAEASRLDAALTHIELPRKEQPTIVEGLSGTTPDAVQEREKALRRRFLEHELGTGPTHRMPLWTWRLGEALLVALPNEAYSHFQTELRDRFGDTPLLVLTTTNGGVGYLCPRELYGSGLYQEQQSPYSAGCLEQTIDAAATALAALQTG